MDAKRDIGAEILQSIQDIKLRKDHLKIQKDLEDAEIALQRINALDFKTYTTDEVREWLKKKK
ncbi:hypothetical protein H6P87_00877 [Rickettsia tillamookensis]|uniref:Uncharacterized protein n=1 Tax=Rickettsia tillamookensis TaxID=2761623 RepID=A0A9E6SQN1_9RICK|nr:hypothetical protein [Rickettsia tillamookensis]QQV75324.1 hypothetical protein H6P87_00877 [Rickettsia tillamookensis]